MRENDDGMDDGTDDGTGDGKGRREGRTDIHVNDNDELTWRHLPQELCIDHSGMHGEDADVVHVVCATSGVTHVATHSHV